MDVNVYLSIYLSTHTNETRRRDETTDETRRAPTGPAFGSVRRPRTDAWMDGWDGLDPLKSSRVDATRRDVT